ncbi:MAG: MFS transporter [Kiritimatiellae bacterium]|nr:MFS transporter [Kiritimatiellia bacterium]
MKIPSYGNVCRPGSGAGAFFASILVWGVGMGCFGAVFNNFLVELYGISGLQRGLLEFLRETPGVMLVAILAALHGMSDWKVLRLGTACSLAAALLLLVPVPFAGVVPIVVLWALGEHLVMPVRQSIALSIAKEGRSGESLGIVTGAIGAGNVAGSLAVAAVFFFGARIVGPGNARIPYSTVFAIVALLVAASLGVASAVREPGLAGRARPSFYFRRKYWHFYVLELFYGARKQVFFTFGPFVLVKIYRMPTQRVAALFALSALLTAIWGGRLTGRLVDRWGYRNVMIWDTVVLFFVCLLYGYARDLFSLPVATVVVCVNYVLDAVLSNASMATNLYARTLADSQEELTATLTSGISVNHVVTVAFALVGGFVFDRWGPGVLFAFASAMALANSAFAVTVPKPAPARGEAA